MYNNAIDIWYRETKMFHCAWHKPEHMTHLERIFRTPLRSFSLLNASCDFLAENCFIETKECRVLAENGYIATSKSTNMFNQRSLSNTSILNTKKRQHHHQPSSNQWKRSLIDNTTLTHRYTIYWFNTDRLLKLLKPALFSSHQILWIFVEKAVFFAQQYCNNMPLSCNNMPQEASFHSQNSVHLSRKRCFLRHIITRLLLK